MAEADAKAAAEGYADGDRAAEPRLLKKARNPLQADVWLLPATNVTSGAAAFIRKDMSGRAWLVRRTWGRWLTAREAAALRALDGCEFAPRLIATTDATLDMEFVAGDRLPRRRDDEGLTDEQIDAIRAVVAEMHARGVAHGDLRRTNILLDADTGAIRLIDFGTASTVASFRWVGRIVAIATISGARGRRSAEWLLAQQRRIDEAKLARLIAEYRGDEALTDEERDAARGPWFQRIGRALRSSVYRPLKRLLVPSRRRSRR